MLKLMTEEEVSRALNVSIAALRRWRLEQRGPVFIKVGSLYAIGRKIWNDGCRVCLQEEIRKAGKVGWQPCKRRVDLN